MLHLLYSLVLLQLVYVVDSADTENALTSIFWTDTLLIFHELDQRLWKYGTWNDHISEVGWHATAAAASTSLPEKAKPP